MTAALSFVHQFEPASDPIRSPILLLHGTGGDESDLLPADLGQFDDARRCIGEAVAGEIELMSPERNAAFRTRARRARTGEMNARDSVIRIQRSLLPARTGERLDGLGGVA